MIYEWAEQTAAGAAPRESHPPAVCRALPIACDAFNARTVAVREYLFFCVSSPMNCHAHFPVQVWIARFVEGFRAPAVRLGTEGMYLSALYCTGIIRRAFFVKSLVPGRGKGEHALGVALHRQYLKTGHDAVQQLCFQSEPHILSTHRNSFPYSSFTGRIARKRMYPR